MKEKLGVIGPVAILICAVILALFKVTGVVPHIIVSIVAVVFMLACMVTGKDSWKVPAVEILYRVCFLVALITGFVIKSGSAPAAVTVVHKVGAAAFAVLFVVASAIALKAKK